MHYTRMKSTVSRLIFVVLGLHAAAFQDCGLLVVLAVFPFKSSTLCGYQMWLSRCATQLFRLCEKISGQKHGGKTISKKEEMVGNAETLR